MMTFKHKSCQIFKIMMGLCLSTFSLLAAKDIHVDNNLQKAIDEAQAEDRLILYGTFTGPFTINRSLTLTGAGEGATLDGNHEGRVLTILGEQGEIKHLKTKVILENLTIKNGLSSDNGGGIYSEYTDLTLTSVEVKENEAAVNGGGIEFISGFLKLFDCKIEKNKAQRGDGGGIHVGSSHAFLSSNTTVKENQALAGSGGGINSYTISGQEQGNMMIIGPGSIKKNQASNGGGLYNGGDLSKPATLAISAGFNIHENEAISTPQTQAKGGGVLNEGIIALYLTTIENNKVNPAMQGFGGGIYSTKKIHGEGYTIEDNTPDNIVSP